MTHVFLSLSSSAQALIAGLFTWAITAVGATVVLFVARPSRALLDAMLGFAAGIMIAASFWSLLAPAVEMARDMGLVPWLAPALGFAAGSGFMFMTDRLLPHLHPGLGEEQAEGLRTRWRRSILLVSAITLHNIPEGLAIGVAFGAAAAGLKGATVTGAIALAVGIGIQNFPEGLAVALPLRREGLSRLKSLWYGQLSAVVEPLAAVAGAAAVGAMRPALPYALAFAAGAMLFVVVEELIPESQRSANTDVATAGTLLGFLVMTVLDVALG